MTERFDLIVRGGTLVDGSGEPGVPGDLGVRGGRIAALGEVEGDADRVIDATGCIVSPGFIDVHTHYDAQVLWDRMLSISPWHGVTTVVSGNCGFGVAPTRPDHRELILRTLENVEGMSYEALHEGIGDDWPFESFPEYLDAVEDRGVAINFAALLGHTPLRLYVMGEEATEREATAAEVEEMRAITADALRAGAIGFATSKSPTHVGYAGRPVPSRKASLDEIKTIANALREVPHGVMQGTAGAGFLFNEFAEITEATGKPLSWTALLTGTAGPDGHKRMLAAGQALQDKGLPVYPQVTCRPLLFEFQFSAPFPFESLRYFRPISAADREGKKKIYADESFREQFRDKEAGGFTGNWDTTLIVDVPGQPDLAERNVGEVASERGVDPVDLVLDLALDTDLEARFRMAIFNTDEEGVSELLNAPSVVLGLSDAGAHASQLCDACFSTHLLGYWVREKGEVGLEQAVRLLTSRSAEVFGITDRGRLEVGLAADLAVFDPDVVACSKLERVHDLPAGADRLISRATGMRAVVVNGQVIRENDRDAIDPDGPLPGRVLRGGCAS